MTSYVALLRAVNVGGTSKLAMADLRRIAEELGFSHPRTFIASGNLLVASEEGASAVRARIEDRLVEHMGKRVPVIVRTAAELAQVAEANPFGDAPSRRVLVTFLDKAPPADTLDHVKNRDGERIAVGTREIYVDYCGTLLGRSKLRIPAAEAGTARNMNTVARLAEMARESE
jgi:uncharacterized protein (DUF1697 family)